MQVSGNYFDASITPAPLAFQKNLTGEAGAAEPAADASASPSPAPAAASSGADEAGVLHRRWSLGEVITAIAAAGLVIVRLEEEAGAKLDDEGLPKVFTVVATRA